MVDAIGQALGAYMLGLFIIGILITALIASAVLAVLKLCGVLLLSWWWVLGIFPALIVVSVIITALVLGFKAIFG